MSIVSQNVVKHGFFTRQDGIGGKFGRAGRLFMQNKPNFRKAAMFLNFYLTKDYENKSNWTLGENEPKQSQFRNFIYPQRDKIKHNYLPVALFPLTSGTARDYNEISGKRFDE